MNLDALLETLGFCAQALAETANGDMRAANVSWHCALNSSRPAREDGTQEGRCLGVIVEACAPSFAARDDRADLWLTIRCLGEALLPAIDGDTATAGDALLDTCGQAMRLDGWNEYFRVVLIAAWDAAVAEVAA